MVQRLALLLALPAVGLLLFPSLPAPEGDGPEERAARRAQRHRAVLADPLFRGRPVVYWRERVLHGDFKFGGWSGSLSLEHEPGQPFFFRGDPASRAVVPLALVLAKDPHPYVREMAVVLLGKYGPWQEGEAFAALVEGLDDEDAVVRGKAARGLQQFDYGIWKRRAAEVLARSLRDDDPDVQWEAAVSLRALGVPKGSRLERAVARIRRREEAKPVTSEGYVPPDDEERRGWRDLDNRRAIFLANYPFTDEMLASLTQFRRLMILDLSGTRITDAGLVHLRGLTDLRDLDVRRTAVTAEGVSELQRALPHLHATR